MTNRLVLPLYRLLLHEYLKEALFEKKEDTFNRRVLNRGLIKKLCRRPARSEISI